MNPPVGPAHGRPDNIIIQGFFVRGLKPSYLHIQADAGHGLSIPYDRRADPTWVVNECCTFTIAGPSLLFVENAVTSPTS